MNNERIVRNAYHVAELKDVAAVLKKVFAHDQVLEVGNVDGRLHVARKPRHPPHTRRRVGRASRDEVVLLFQAVELPPRNEDRQPAKGDSTHILPPCISIIRFDMAIPKPVPPFLRVIALSAC